MLLRPEPVQPGVRKPSTHCLGVGNLVDRARGSAGSPSVWVQHRQAGVRVREQETGTNCDPSVIPGESHNSHGEQGDCHEIT